MADAAAIFIDGGYLMKVLRDEFGSPRIDFKKLAERMAGEDTIFRTYYYNCMPHQSSTPTTMEQQRYGKARSFYDALNGCLGSRFALVNSRFAESIRTAILFTCKSALTSCSESISCSWLPQRIATACLLTGDSDFIPAVEVAKNEGVNIHLFHGNRGQVHDEI